MTSNKPFALIHRTEMFICIDESGEFRLITNKGLTVNKDHSTFIVNKRDTYPITLDCEELCSKNGITWGRLNNKLNHYQPTLKNLKEIIQ